MSEVTYDRVVIGAGIIGACAAYQLVKAGHRSVLLLDQFPLPHSRGSSHGQTRVIRTAYRDPVQGQMARRTRKLWSDIERQAGETLCVDCPMLVVSPPSNRELFDTYLACLDDQTVYEGSQLRQLLPAGRLPDDYVACVDSSAGLLRADKCLRAVRRLFEAGGGRLWDGWPVSAVLPHGDTVEVVGPAGRCRARRLLVCAGAWAGPLLATLGLPLERLLTPFRVPVTYWRLRPGFTFQQSGTDLGPPNGTLHYWLPSLEYPGLVKLCGHAGALCDPKNRDLASVDDVIQQTIRYVQATFPALEPQPNIVETCMYTETPDRRCILDVHPLHANIVIAAGMSGEGFKMGPVFGEVLQCLADGERCQFDLSQFSMQRFIGAAARDRSSL